MYLKATIVWRHCLGTWRQMCTVLLLHGQHSFLFPEYGYSDHVFVFPKNTVRHTGLVGEADVGSNPLSSVYKPQALWIALGLFVRQLGVSCPERVLGWRISHIAFEEIFQARKSRFDLSDNLRLLGLRYVQPSVPRVECGEINRRLGLRQSLLGPSSFPCETFLFSTCDFPVTHRRAPEPAFELQDMSGVRSRGKFLLNPADHRAVYECDLSIHFHIS